MKINGFRTLAALVAVLFGFSASSAMAQSSYQYLISDQEEATKEVAKEAPKPVAQDTTTMPEVVQEELDDSNFLKFGGWLQAGYHSYNTGQFNNRPDNVNLHQAYAYMEKAANGDNGLGLGFRMDYVYGIDGPDTQAFFGPAGHWDEGWDNGGFYGHAIPQLYGEFAWGDANIKVGKFYTIMGYEVVTAPDNFFYSHSYTMFNSEPFTHTGVLGEFDMGDVTLWGGWTLGWDSGFDSSIADGNAFLGGASLSFGDAGSMTGTTTFGRLGAGSGGAGFASSFVTDLNLTEKLNFVLQSDYVQNDLVNESYGVNTYLLYSLTDQIGIGTRMEWWNSNVFGAPTGKSDLYAITSGLNIKAGENLIMRPEFRWNRDDDGILIPAGDNNNWGFGMDVILTF